VTTAALTAAAASGSPAGIVGLLGWQQATWAFETLRDVFAFGDKSLYSTSYYHANAAKATRFFVLKHEFSDGLYDLLMIGNRRHLEPWRHGDRHIQGADALDWCVKIEKCLVSDDGCNFRCGSVA
jgi:hypothetical protein